MSSSSGSYVSEFCLVRESHGSSEVQRIEVAIRAVLHWSGSGSVGCPCECERDFTIKDLTAAGYKRWTRLITRRAGSPRAASDYKSGDRKKLVAGGYLVVLNIGDQESDLTGESALKNFKLPDPFYLVQ